MSLQKKIQVFAWLLVWATGVQTVAQQYYEINPLSINTSAKELAPAFYKDGLVFCSDRKNEWFIRYTDMDDNLLTNLYLSEQKRSGKFEHPQLFSKNINTKLFEGPATFSKEGNRVYFTRSIDVTPGLRKQVRRDTTFGIYTAELINGQWQNIEPFPYNSPAYNVGYPSLSADGTEMYFCSSDPAGEGGFDLYQSRLKNGIWTTPENLGDVINTPGNEVFPFIHESGRLYFSSRGLNQTGDLDIYYSEFRDGEWTIPRVLPEPFNSDYDDYGLILTAKMDTGYFVSDRQETPDIYQVYSTIPVFSECQSQEENSYCYVLYESNNTEIDTSAFAYEWDFGDGEKERSAKVEHCYQTTGTYQVKLNVIDKLTGDVFYSEAEYHLVVEDIEQPYITAPDTAFVGDPVDFSGSNSYYKDYEIRGYYWDFGDADRAAGVEARHVYNNPGVYMLQLGLEVGTDDSSDTVEKKCVTRNIVILKKD